MGDGGEGTRHCGNQVVVVMGFFIPGTDGPSADDQLRPAGTRSVHAPETMVKSGGVPGPSQLTKCSECERPIT